MLDPAPLPAGERPCASVPAAACPLALGGDMAAVGSPSSFVAVSVFEGGLFGGGNGGAVSVFELRHGCGDGAARGTEEADARALVLRVRPNHGLLSGAETGSAVEAASSSRISSAVCPVQKRSTPRKR